jgi:hypothetical protein
MTRRRRRRRKKKKKKRKRSTRTRRALREPFIIASRSARTPLLLRRRDRGGSRQN